MTTVDKGEKHAFTALDFGGQGLKGISQNLFRYQFLEKLYFNANKLNWLTPQIGLLRSLTFLDLSQNQLAELPPEIGMLVNLKTLLLFDNNLTDLPSEMGYLYQLDTLGLEGNPLNDDMKNIVAESGTGELIRTLREHAAGKLMLVACCLSPVARCRSLILGIHANNVIRAAASKRTRLDCS